MKSQKTYDGQTARFIAAVAGSMPKISGRLMQFWIDEPTALRQALSKVLHFQEFIEIRIEPQKTFASVIDRLMSCPQFTVCETTRSVLKSEGYRVRLLKDSSAKISTVKVTSDDLGLYEGKKVRLDAIVDRAREMGLSLCPVEAGPLLRAQYVNQRRGEVYVVSDFVRTEYDANNRSRLFCLSYRSNEHGPLYLSVPEMYNIEEFDEQAEFVFVQ